MTTVESLYAEVLRNPADDTVRLVMSDALQERGEPGDEDRANFIRHQIELSRIGEPPHVYEAVVARINDGYFVVDIGGADDDGIKVGDRLTVRDRSIRRSKNLHNVEVVKVFPAHDWDAGAVLHLRSDEHSNPYPKTRVKFLTGWASRLFYLHWHSWARLERIPTNGPGEKWLVVDPSLDISLMQTPGLRGVWVRCQYPSIVLEGSGGVALQFVNGFVEDMRCTLKYWGDNGDRLVRDFPIRHVHLTNGLNTPGFAAHLSGRWTTIPESCWSFGHSVPSGL